MNSRNSVLLAVGMLLLGLGLGVVAGGTTGFFIGRRNNQFAFSRFQQMTPYQQPYYPPQQTQPTVPPSNQPLQPNTNPRRLPSTQNTVGGARVEEVEKGMAADQAGIQVGDVITAVGGVKLDTNHSLSDLIKTHKPGEKVDLAITRGDKTLMLSVTLGASAQDATAAYLGIRFTPLTPSGRFRTPNGTN